MKLEKLLGHVFAATASLSGLAGLIHLLNENPPDENYLAKLIGIGAASTILTIAYHYKNEINENYK